MPAKIQTPELNDKALLATLYMQYNTLEIAERLGCSHETVRKRIHSFGIEMRNGPKASTQTRIRKTLMDIRLRLCEFDRATQALILGPVVAELKEYLADDPICPICRQAPGHLYWCSMAQPHNAIMED